MKDEYDFSKGVHLGDIVQMDFTARGLTITALRQENARLKAALKEAHDCADRVLRNKNTLIFVGLERIREITSQDEEA